MARETLLAPAAVPEKSILRMRGEIDPQIAAQEYEDQLDLMARQHSEPIYRHDLILLGLGDDGHTASLFPGTAALEETTRRVVANFVPKLNAWRLTFTFPLINQARHILFLVGAAKNPGLIERVLEGDQQLPAARVRPFSRRSDMDDRGVVAGHGLPGATRGRGRTRKLRRRDLDVAPLLGATSHRDSAAARTPARRGRAHMDVSCGHPERREGPPHRHPTRPPH